MESPQGRTGSDFEDCNAALLGELAAAHPDLVSLEMETFQLLDLARCSRGECVCVLWKGGREGGCFHRSL